MATSASLLNSRPYLQRRNEELYKEMLRPGALKPRLTIAKLVGFILALAIHSVTLYFVWACLWNLANGVIGLTAGNPIKAIGSFAIACGTLFVAWQLRPRLGRWPSNVLDRTQIPAIYELVDKVAETLKIAPIYALAITFDYNFAFANVGIRRKKLIFIGLPLWAVLNDQERIAIIAHELAHYMNGDASRGLVIGSAYKAIIRWYNFAATMMRPTLKLNLGFVFAPIWYISLILLTVLRHLLLHESRRAEYLADTLAAESAGTEATLSMLRKVQFDRKYAAFVLYTSSKNSVAALFSRFREYIDTVCSDPKSLQDIERENLIRDAHYNFTHPPMALRQRFLQAQSQTRSKFVLLADECTRLANETNMLIEAMQNAQ